MDSANTSPHIGTLTERSLHAAIKEWYGRPGDQLEVRVEGYVIDIVRGGLLIEIQTRHLYALTRKLTRLLPNFPVRLVHPIPQEKWIVRQAAGGRMMGRRKSPRHGRPVDIFRELVRIPDLLCHPNLSIELLLTQQDEILRDDGAGSWRRRGWSIVDQLFLGVVDQYRFESPADYCALLPPRLDQPFTNHELAAALRCPLALAQKMSFTLRRIGCLSVTGKRGNALLHQSVELEL
jgi:hypothetical protein